MTDAARLLAPVLLAWACAGAPASDGSVVDSDDDEIVDTEPGDTPVDTAAVVDGSTLADVDGDGAPVTTDCDDLDPAAHPGAEELVGDDIDEDCDHFELCYVDTDGDGARGTATDRSLGPCLVSDKHALISAPIDCDDADPARAPGAFEVTGDGVDNDCDGLEACRWDADLDGNPGGGTIGSVDLDCGDVGEAGNRRADDCDDGDPAIHPGAGEIADDGVDQDCDGREDCPVDDDRDGWPRGHATSLDLTCGGPGAAHPTLPETDCADHDPNRNPGMRDIPDDGIDQDCDGTDACAPGGTRCPGASCADLHAHGATADGAYWVSLDGVATEVWCRQRLDGGGWSLAAVIADDDTPAWSTDGDAWGSPVAIVGAFGDLDHDYRSRVFDELRFHDLLFVATPSRVWAAYHRVGGDYLDLGGFLASPSACGTYTMSAGTLSSPCGTDLDFGSVDGGGCPGTPSIPAWRTTDEHGGCGVLSPLGPDPVDPAAESPSLGFVGPAGLPVGGTVEVYVR